MHAHGTCTHNWISVPSAHAHSIAYAYPAAHAHTITHACPMRMRTLLCLPTAYALHTQLQRRVALRMRTRLHLMLKMHACPTAFAYGLLAAYLFCWERVHGQCYLYLCLWRKKRLKNKMYPMCVCLSLAYLISHLFVFCLRNCGITKVIWIILSKPSSVNT